MNNFYRDSLAMIIKNSVVKREAAVQCSGGEVTDIYLDLKRVLSNPTFLTAATNALHEHLALLSGVTAVGGPTMGADCVSHAHSVLFGTKWFSVRGQAQTHALGKLVEGAELGPDDQVVLIDDVASSGRSLAKAFEAVVETGATVLAIVPLVDRGDEAAGYFDENIYSPLLSYVDLGIPSLTSQ